MPEAKRSIGGYRFSMGGASLPAELEDELDELDELELDEELELEELELELELDEELDEEELRHP